MITEGKIVIDLATNPDGRSLDVCIRSNRISNIGKVFKGRTPEETLALLPKIFSVCGKAHSWAASRAFRSLGLEEELVEPTGWLVVLAENAREHLLRVILGWSRDNPETIEQLPVRQVMSLVGDMTAATSTGQKQDINSNAVKDLANSLAGLLKDHLFALPPDQWL